MVAGKANNSLILNGSTAETRRLFEKFVSSAGSVSLMTRILSEIETNLKCSFVGATDFDVVMNRIENAKRYLRSGETGPARYEIRLLVSEFCLTPNQVPPAEGPNLVAAPEVPPSCDVI